MVCVSTSRETKDGSYICSVAKHMGKIPLVPLPRHTEPNPVTNAISSFSYSFGLLQKKLMLLLAVEPVTTYKQLPIKEGGVTNKVLLIKQEKNASL